MSKNFWEKRKVVITGGKGFLGTYLTRIISAKKPGGLVSLGSSDGDLRDYKTCLRVCKNKDIVIHLAAKVGGIGYNREKPAELFDDNILMGINMVRAAKECGVKKFVYVGTVCSYPKFTPVPFKEENLWMGYPEETNAPYGIAKKAVLVQLTAYRDQYNFNGVYLLPVNLYGPGDNFSPESSHVIPALIKKIAEAKSKGADSVVVWGTGKATREFLYVEDAAYAIAKAIEKYNKPEPVNLGSGAEISIKKLATKIGNILGFKGKIIWDKTKPDGQPRRMLDTEKAKKEFGFVAKTKFDEGLRATIDWYLNYVKDGIG